MNREESLAPSPIIAMYQALRARRPKWPVEMGQPHGPGWNPGTALLMAWEDPFQAILARIGERLQTADRRTIAASLRYGTAGRLESPLPPICSTPVCRRSRSTTSPSNSMTMGRSNARPSISRQT